MAGRIILMLLGAVYVALCIFCVAEFHRRATNKGKAVYLPSFMFWLGAVVGALFLIFALQATKQEGETGLTVCFGFFSLLGMLLMLGWRNCFISYDEVGFTRKNLVGMRRSFTYDQVTAWRDNMSNPMESTLYAAGKKVSFNLLSPNGPDFLVTVSAGYRKTHGNRNMPEMPRPAREKGGFRAHVRNPGEFLAVFIMLFAFVGGACVWTLISCMRPVDEGDAEEYTLAFSSWEIEEDSLFLQSPKMEESFVIRAYEEYLSGFDRLTEKCDGNTMFSVWAEEVEPDDAEAYYLVYALSSEGEVYRTFEDSSAWRRDNMSDLLWIFGLLLFVLLAFSALVYFVGSNPKKFPKWVVYCCFKRDAIDIF